MSTGAGASDLLHAEDTGVDEIIPAARRSRRDRRSSCSGAACAATRSRWSRSASSSSSSSCAILAGSDRASWSAPRAERPVDRRARRLRPPHGPSSEHIIGVDQIGRDVFARVLYGARVSLKVAFIGTGLVRGDRRHHGHDRGLLPRLGRHGSPASWTSCSPSPCCCSGSASATACSDRDGCLGGALQPGLSVVIFIIIIANWPYVARIIRGQVLSLREKEFVEASRSLGASSSGSSSARSCPTWWRRSSCTRRCSSRRTSCSRRRSQLPRRRHPAAGNRRGARCSRTPPRSSTPPGGTCCSRAWRSCYGPRLQPRRRWPAGRPQPEGLPLRMTMAFSLSRNQFHNHERTLHA